MDAVSSFDLVLGIGGLIVAIVLALFVRSKVVKKRQVETLQNDSIGVQAGRDAHVGANIQARSERR